MRSGTTPADGHVGCVPSHHHRGLQTTPVHTSSQSWKKRLELESEVRIAGSEGIDTPYILESNSKELPQKQTPGDTSTSCGTAVRTRSGLWALNPGTLSLESHSAVSPRNRFPEFPQAFPLSQAGHSDLAGGRLSLGAGPHLWWGSQQEPEAFST